MSKKEKELKLRDDFVLYGDLRIYFKNPDSCVLHGSFDEFHRWEGESNFLLAVDGRVWGPGGYTSGENHHTGLFEIVFREIVGVREVAYLNSSLSCFYDKVYTAKFKRLVVSSVKKFMEAEMANVDNSKKEALNLLMEEWGTETLISKVVGRTRNIKKDIEKYPVIKEAFLKYAKALGIGS